MEKRLVAPAIITFCMILLCILFAIPFLIFDVMGLWVQILTLAFLLVAIGVCVFVLWERVKEIRSGEEDDLGKY
ncbi:MAG: hypothetical protein FWG96_00370 [Methanomassiliicoccaceae archaeon]|nr:hypothetical protein [Methanomassiliicoccaceae archaeon]